MSKTYNPASTPSHNTIKRIVVIQQVPLHIISVEASPDGEHVSLAFEAGRHVSLTHETALELIGALHDVMDDMDAEEQLTAHDIDYKGCTDAEPPYPDYR